MHFIKIINQSIMLEEFPKICKLADIIPKHKSGSTCEVKNYRPISLLPNISKIQERIMHSQIMNYCIIHSILPYHSTTTTRQELIL